MPARLETLQAKKKQIDAQIQAIKAREARNVRARDTRRKIVIGSAALKLVEDGKIRMEDLTGQLSARDRKLFDREPSATTLQAIQDSIDGKTTPTTIEEIMAEIDEAQNAEN